MTGAKTRGPLKLRAVDAEDLGVVSAHLQDAVLSFGDMEYFPGESCFAVVVSRFLWETGTDGPGSATKGQRVHCGIRFENVRAVRLRNLDRKDRSRVLELLAIAPEAGYIDLLFAERGRVRLEVDGILCHVQDLDEPWPTRWRPEHPVAD